MAHKHFFPMKHLVNFQLDIPQHHYKIFLCVFSANTDVLLHNYNTTIGIMKLVLNK